MNLELSMIPKSGVISTNFEEIKEKLEEEIFLGFRRLEGINCKKINEKFGINFEEKYSKIL